MDRNHLPSTREELTAWSLANTGRFSDREPWGEQIVRGMDHADSLQTRFDIISWANKLQKEFPSVFSTRVSGAAKNLQAVIIAEVIVFNLQPDHSLILNIEAYNKGKNNEENS